MGETCVARGSQDGVEVRLYADGLLELSKDLDVGATVRITWGIESPPPAILDHVLESDERVWLEWFVGMWRVKVRW